MSRDIEKVMRDTINDFDWEVKMLVLNFWDRILARLETGSLKRDSTEQQCTDAVLQAMCDKGALVVLLEAFDDYDKPVQKKACVMLKSLKVKYVGEAIDGDTRSRATDGVVDDNDATDQEMVSPSERGTVQMSPQDVDTSTNDGTTVTKVAAGHDVSEFNRWLRTIDLDSVCVTIDQSTDRYADNPESLVDDLLTSLERIEHMTDTEGEESGEENVIDCY